MKISKLSLHNFGIYSGVNIFNLESQKPVILVGGMNGRGKTTFLEAILMALYGRRSFAFKENKFSFTEYLKRLVNKIDRSLETYIELDFKQSGDNITNYNIRREWNLKTAIPTMKTIVKKDGIYDKILSDNWDLFVEDLLPSALAPLFIFDGEKISELANSDNDIDIKNSIKDLMGISVIEQSIVDIKKIMNKQKKNIKSESYNKEISEYERLIKQADKESKESNDIVAMLTSKKLVLEKKLQESENDFLSLGGNLTYNRVELEEKKSNLILKQEEITDKIIESLSGDLPLLLILPLLKEISSVAQFEREQKAILIALEELPSLMHKYNCNRENKVNFDGFLEFMKENNQDLSLIYDLNDRAFEQLNKLCSLLPTYHYEEIIRLLEKRKNIEKELISVKDYLEINVNEMAIEKKLNQIKKVTAELATIMEQLKNAEEQAKIKNLVWEDLNRKYSKVIETVVRNMEDTTDSKRLLIYSGYAIEVLDEYKKRIQKDKTQQLAKTMTSCFKQIESKQNLINKIRVDDTTLDFIYEDAFGNKVDKSAFSAGEKQLLVISMLWALGICSNKSFPVIVDTPLARLDSIHREALIKNYFPKASEQTILLSTDSEIYGRYYDFIRPFVDREYTLIYDDMSKKVSVENGYFGGLIV